MNKTSIRPEDIQWVLNEKFGFSEFRSVQREVLIDLMHGHSGLLMMPTGEGKSLCYQLPAFLLDGLVLVLSPLIALMDDQKAKAEKLGLRVEAIHSNQKREQRKQAYDRLKQGHLDLLYVTPERFRKDEFLQALS